MAKSYSQFRAILAIAKAGLMSIFRSPSTVAFSFGFPLIFILVFGFVGNYNKVSVKTAFTADSDTTSVVYRLVAHNPGIQIVDGSRGDVQSDLAKGRITAILQLKKNPDGKFEFDITSSASVPVQDIELLQSILSSAISTADKRSFPDNKTVAAVNEDIKLLEGRKYSSIDFILPGQLGFSLLSAGVFGVAFLFFNLRQTLVLKRFFTTPVSKLGIVLGEGLSRIVFQLIAALVIIVIGFCFFNFTLHNGWLTVVELMVLSGVGILVFMSLGFIVSGLAKTEAVIPPLANIVTLPQFLLAGTFFSIENFPAWLQPFCKILPLTHLNNAMRNVAFEGAHLYHCITEILVLLAWGVVGYAVAVKVFRWE